MTDAYAVVLAGLLVVGAFLLLALDPGLGMAAVCGAAAVVVGYWLESRNG